jgi:predicted NAD/FAD-dependent oxidoreductase
MTNTLFKTLAEPPESVAIIGAGMAGLTCATSLMMDVPQVRVFERALHAGGRMATYRGRGYEFDAGTQYFTAHDDLFREALEGWLLEGVVQPWQGWVVELDRGNFMSRDTMPRYVGTPNMSALARHLAELCDVSIGTEVVKLTPEGDGVRLVDRLGEDLGRYDLVVLALPPAPAARLAAMLSPALAERARGVQMTKCWSVMLGFDAPLGLPYDGAYVFNSQLNWVAHNNSKPKRAERETWVLHATPEWTEQHSEMEAEAVIQTLVKAFENATGGRLPKPRMRAARLWEQAAPIDGQETPFLFDAEGRLGMCGDWCVSPRLEGAFRSGWSLANFVQDAL